MVFISHDLQTVRQVSDRIVVMNGGLIVEQGEAMDIFDNPQQKYIKFYLMQHRHYCSSNMLENSLSIYFKMLILN